MGLTKPWANIIPIDALKSHVNMAIVTNPIWAIEEYAINLFISA
tara:strand:- start:1759 stop:1890 length:132 start_codon:yes stop_codon:yes gene_type:complete